MRVFVAGANGAVGRRLVPMLVARGHQVTGTTTSEASAEAHPGAGRRAGRRRRPRCRRDRRGGGQSGAGCHHPRDDGPVGHARLPALRSLVRPDEPAADGGHRASPRGGQGERRQAVRRPELHRLEQQPGRARGSRRRTIRSIRTRSRSRPRRSPRSSSSSAPSSRRRSRGSSSATAGSTGRARPRRSPTSSASGCSRSSATARASCRRPTSTTRPPARSPPWSAAGAASTTSSTTTRRRPREFIPAIAEALGAPKPLRIPAWLGRLLAGDVAVTMMTEGRGSSNAKAKRELGWQPIWPSWRDGFRRGLDTPVPLPPPMPATSRPRRSRPPRDPSRSPARCRRGLCRPSAAALLDRLPDARERQRGRGHRPGGVRPLPAGARRRHRGRVAEGLPVGGRHPPRDRPPQVGPRPARDVRRRVAAGAARDRRGRRRPGRASPSRPTRCRCRSSSCSSG